MRLAKIVGYFVFGFLGTPLLAQTNVNEEQGLKPYDSWHGGDLDSISMSNGALTLHIPLVSYPQRGGLDLSFSAFSNTKQWSLIPNCQTNPTTGEQDCTYQYKPIPRGGVLPKFGQPVVDGVFVASSVDYWLQTACDVEPPDPISPNQTLYDWSYALVAPDGNGHSFGNGIGSGCMGFPLYALDGSGIVRTDATTVIMPSGVRYSYLNGQSVSIESSMPSSVTDTNGNQISISSGGAFIDTLGRNIPSPAGISSDLSNCPAGSSSASSWTVPGPYGVARTFKFCYSIFNIYSSFGSDDYPPTNTSLLSAIILPDLTAWTFTYDHWGDVTRLGFPTGGSITYEYALGPFGSSLVTTSRTVDANDGTGGHRWTYTYTWTTQTATGTVIVASPDGNETVHTITAPISGAGGSLYETQVQYYQGSHTGGILVKTASTQYSGIANPLDSLAGSGSAANVVPTQLTTTFFDGRSSRAVSTYDSGNTETISTGLGNPFTVPVVFGSLWQRDEYDFSNTLIRSTLHHYLWQDNSTYKTNNLLALELSSTLKDGAGCEVSKTSYGYDETYNGITVQPSGVTTQMGSPAAVRGNRTSTSRWLISNCAEQSTISAHTIPYDTGLPYQTFDPLGHMTQNTYSSAFAGAYLTQTNLPDTQMPDPGAAIVHHVISGNYDFNTGLLTSFTDQNNQQYTYSYDNMLRLTVGNHPDGGQTKFFYPDPNTVERQRLIAGTTYDDFKMKFDGLGRPYQSQQLTPECASYIKVDTTYDGVGQIRTVSNPYCLTNEPTYGLTQTDYDALGRTIKTTKQDGSFTTAKYEDTPADSSGAPLTCVTVTDESGRKRQTCSDASGYLAKVVEPNPGAAATNATGWITVSGTEQLATGQPAVAANVTVTIGGTDSSNTVVTCGLRCITTHPKDTGSMSFTVMAGGVTIGPVSISGGYNGNSTPASLAAALYSAFPSNSTVTMTNPNGTATFTLTAVSAGIVGNGYTISTSMVSNCVPGSTDTTTTTCAGVGWTMTLSGPNLSATTVSPQNFSGGQNASNVSDTGSVTVTVNGTNYPTTFGSGDTSSTIASRLATAISGGTYANAAASGGTINLTSKTPGTAGDYSFSASYTWNSAQFTNPSFTTSASGSTLSGALDASALNNSPLITTYQYNSRGDLLCVHQKGTDTTSDVACTGSAPPSVPASWRQRFFTHDSLSRLLTSMNPEMNSTGNTVVTYTYDNDSRLITKQTPAPNQPWGSSTMVTVTYTYDALDRPLDVTFSDSTQGSSHRYDYGTVWGVSVQNPVGREVLASAANGTIGFITSYDPMGRAINTWQCNPGVSGCKTFTSTFDKLGDLTSIIYPGNSFTVTYSYDNAARLTSATDSNGVIYAQNPTYIAGSVIREFTSPNFNNNKFHTEYNNRLQPVEIWAGAGQGGSALFDKQYAYGTSGSNNGNILTITNVKDSTRTQSYTYDPLNRLLTAGDNGHWANSYTYDPWGNLTNKTPGAPAGENLNKTADTNNHLSGLTYDAAGNVINDGAGGAFVFDAASRITTAGTTTYTYDADSRRIRKSSGINYWYGPGGQVLAETDSAGNWTNYIFFGEERLARNVPQPAPNLADIKYYITDHLRSTAMFVDKAGTTAAILDDNDFYPWGGVVPGVGKTTSNNTIKFSSRYRDSETSANLDYFGARYYSNTVGRFVSPDWADTPVTVPYAKFGDPQSLNLYSYTENAPINRVDLDGHFDDPFGTFSSGDTGMSNMQSRFYQPDTRNNEAAGKNKKHATHKAPKKKKPKRSEAEIRRQFWKKYGKAFNAALAKVFGKDFAKIGPQTAGQMPKIDASQSTKDMEKSKGPDTVGGNRPGSFGPDQLPYAKDGTIRIPSDLWNSDAADADLEIFKTIAHEWANLLDFQINGKASEGTYADPKDLAKDKTDPTRDADTGNHVENTMWPPP